MNKPTFETTVATKDHVGPALEKLKTAFMRSFPDKDMKGTRATVDLFLWRKEPVSQQVELTGDIAKDRGAISGAILDKEAAIAEQAKSYPLRLGLSIQVQQ